MGVSLLYPLAVVAFVSRWYYATVEAQMFRAAVLDLGVALGTPVVTLFIRALVVALGTLTALVFLFSEELYAEPDD